MLSSFSTGLNLTGPAAASTDHGENQVTTGTMIYINKQSGANMVAVSDRVRKTLDNLNNQLTNGKLTLRIDNADFIRQVISNLRTSSLYGMGLSVLVPYCVSTFSSVGAIRSLAK